ncbi:conserved hypothetical protein [Frankia sp. AiPs1]|uniref:hypothetical protein n=1 Tax=Frankia sp. AiPa1 TaxID=573492 RepID=UPI00202B6C2D|nr:hypothetical protein [Frankia sp. AiPa1]MCL9762181.1 hypothetical protein [Frankia sp. AiPa1]
MARHFITRDGRPVDLAEWEPAARAHWTHVEPLSIDMIMRDAGIDTPPAIPGWPAAACDAPDPPETPDTPDAVDGA